MGAFHNLKLLLRSGSWDFVRASSHAPEKFQGALFELNWKGFPIVYRPGTSERGAIYEILLRHPSKTEYFVDPRLRPKIILDIGANIGVTSIWLHQHFPEAEIYSFEPVPTNFELLLKNTQRLGRVHCFNYGLGAEDGDFDVFENNDPNNHGGFSIYERENDSENLGCQRKLANKIKIRRAADALREIGVGHVDILKIDTEGAEFDILSSLPREMLEKCQWVMGELHGNRTYECLAILSPTHQTKLEKSFGSELFTFYARSRDLG